jgi:hypothetical protein
MTNLERQSVLWTLRREVLLGGLSDAAAVTVPAAVPADRPSLSQPPP